MTRRLAWLAVAAVLVAAAVALPVLRRAAPPESPFQTAAVTRGPVVATVSASGTLKPVDQVDVGSAVSGRIQHIRVDFNSSVRVGQVLAEIDPSSFRARVEQCAASAARAQATLQQAGFDLARQKRLAAQDLVATADLERAITAEAQAQADLRQVEAQLASARVDLANTVIRAPIDGVVLSRQVDEGQTVAASLQAPTLFQIARDLADMQVETRVDEADIGRVRAGQPVRFRVDAYPGETFAGTVRQVRLQSTTTSGVVSYTVVIHTRNEAQRLRPGMTADVEIQVAGVASVRRVPNAALRVTEADFRGTIGLASRAGEGDSTLFVLRSGRPERVAVRTGLTDGSSTAITAGDLRDSDQVITQVSATLPKATIGTTLLGGFGPPAGLGRKRS